LRPLALVALALALAGCPDKQPLTGYWSADGSCQVYCGRCPGSSLCLAAPFMATCLPGCDTAADCYAGQKCVIFTTTKYDAPAICWTPGSLQMCGDPIACPKLQPQCLDAHTLMQPLDYPTNYCGYELIACNNGCDATTARCT
jgi:hypothetical protein